ncbi:MAG: hypothetical protein PHC60_07735 [Heliobacteriaceae bacterium]|nr:hypothetical protein [Heliobacteriaceae bacterium]MDD4588261.1 hypothetical protein [Heliobacteriaceae bacterium]
MTKPMIFVRERKKVKEKEKKPRFSVVGVVGTDLRLYVEHIRKMEVEQVAAAVGAEVVYLQAGREAGEEEDEDQD